MNKKCRKLTKSKGSYTKKFTQSSDWQFDFAKQIYDSWPKWKQEIYGKGCPHNRDEMAVNVK